MSQRYNYLMPLVKRYCKIFENYFVIRVQLLVLLSYMFDVIRFDVALSRLLFSAVDQCYCCDSVGLFHIESYCSRNPSKSLTNQ